MVIDPPSCLLESLAGMEDESDEGVARWLYLFWAQEAGRFPEEWSSSTLTALDNVITITDTQSVVYTLSMEKTTNPNGFRAEFF